VVAEAQQERLHGATTAEAVHAVRGHDAVEQERHEKRESVRLAGSVRASEHESAVSELEELVVVLPDVADAGPRRLPPLALVWMTVRHRGAPAAESRPGNEREQVERAPDRSPSR